MCRACAELDVELDLLAAEVELDEALIAAGVAVPGHRQPFAHEIASGARFAEQDRMTTGAAGLLVRQAATVRAAVLAALADAVRELTPPGAEAAAVLAALVRLQDPTSPATLPGLAEVLTAAREAGATSLFELATRARAEALAEAARQGVPASAITAVPDALPAATLVAARVQADRVATYWPARLLAVAVEGAARAAVREGATPEAVLQAATEAATAAPPAGVEDLARQASNVTAGLGRREGLQLLPEAGTFYASELLDSNTCQPCGAVDGRTYATRADAFTDYPGGGGFVGCSGGNRCRGTLVYVAEREAQATVTGGADTARRGPASSAPTR